MVINWMKQLTRSAKTIFVANVFYHNLSKLYIKVYFLKTFVCDRMSQITRETCIVKRGMVWCSNNKKVLQF